MSLSRHRGRLSCLFGNGRQKLFGRIDITQGEGKCSVPLTYIIVNRETGLGAKGFHRALKVW